MLKGTGYGCGCGSQDIKRVQGREEKYLSRDEQFFSFNIMSDRRAIGNRLAGISSVISRFERFDLWFFATVVLQGFGILIRSVGAR
jgi:hypothetical protein